MVDFCGWVYSFVIDFTHFMVDFISVELQTYVVGQKTVWWLPSKVSGCVETLWLTSKLSWFGRKFCGLPSDSWG